MNYCNKNLKTHYHMENNNLLFLILHTEVKLLLMNLRIFTKISSTKEIRRNTNMYELKEKKDVFVVDEEEKERIHPLSLSAGTLH